MRITYELLRRHGACESQALRFRELYPRGALPTVEVLTVLAAQGLDVLWGRCLLPTEGHGSRRALALWFTEQVVRDEVLPVIRRRVEDPSSVSNGELAAAWSAAEAATEAAAWSPPPEMHN